MTLDPSFLAGLTSLKLTPAPVGSAKIDGAVATFPITGGNVTYFTPGSVTPYVQGKINHDGSGRPSARRSSSDTCASRSLWVKVELGSAMLTDWPACTL